MNISCLIPSISSSLSVPASFFCSCLSQLLCIKNRGDLFLIIEKKAEILMKDVTLQHITQHQNYKMVYGLTVLKDGMVFRDVKYWFLNQIRLDEIGQGTDSCLESCSNCMQHVHMIIFWNKEKLWWVLNIWYPIWCCINYRSQNEVAIWKVHLVMDACILSFDVFSFIFEVNLVINWCTGDNELMVNLVYLGQKVVWFYRLD